MPQYEYVQQLYELDSSKEPLEGAVHLRCIEPDYPFQSSFQPLRQNIYQATFSSTEHPLPPHPSVACPKVDSQSMTDFADQSGQKECTWELGDVCAEADWENSAPVITTKICPFVHTLSMAPVLLIRRGTRETRCSSAWVRRQHPWTFRIVILFSLPPIVL
ncbi:hypothetical protein V1522DRAFT_417164, partial [Lipomyces starkeyi]